jgi:hypothetical protein
LAICAATSADNGKAFTSMLAPTFECVKITDERGLEIKGLDGNCQSYRHF